MLSINTNLSSLMVQQNLTKSTNALNTAIERLTTGYKINHAADNAANYSIARNMDSQISAYEVAADNIAMGTDMISTAMDSISLLQNRAERLMDLWNQAQNGTYGEQSIKAIQSEVNAIVDEIDRIYENTEYNGIKLLGYELPDWAQEVKANAGANVSAANNGFIANPVTYTNEQVAAMTSLSSVSPTSTISSGTYKISSKDELKQLATMVNNGKVTSNNVKFVLGGDIDLGGEEWTAIGTYAKQFKGTFDGNGHKITGLKIDKESTGYQGLFGCTASGSTIKNIGVDGDVKGAYCTGILVGDASGSITNSYATGTVSGTYQVGGLAGQADGSITNSYATGTVLGNSSVGGLAGYARGSIENSYATGTVSGTDTVGGLAGYAFGAITNSYATGTVSGNSSVGGLAGYASAITNSYATGTVLGNSSVGGLAGYAYGTIENSYATGNASGEKWVGGLIGQVDFVFYDPELTNVASFGEVSGTDGVGTLVGSLYYEDCGDSEGSLTITNATSSIQNGVGLLGAGTYYDDDEVFINPDYDLTPYLENIQGVQTQTTLQVGIYGNSSSRITTNTHLNDTIRINDISQTSAYSTIQGFLDKLSARSTELGAVYNRLQSAGESTLTAMENLTSSRSTIKDADVAKESSKYIKSQILQQASATLLSTANQTPALTLQLLQGLR